MREHKSNQVYWIVDLEAFVCVQRCFDIECRYFQSEPENIPDDIRKAVESKLGGAFEQAFLFIVSFRPEVFFS